MREQLRLSLDIALKIQRMVEVIRSTIKDELAGNEEKNIEAKADKLNDELIATMLETFNALGKIMSPLANATEIIVDRLSWLGEGDGLEKKFHKVEFKDKEESPPEEEEEEDESET